jgi:hypothetical protein
MNKNNILLLVIIVLIIILIAYGYLVFFKLNTEGFQTVEQNMEDSKHKCKFYPWGPTLESCKSNCMSNQRMGLWDETGGHCTEEICSEICGLCNHESSCQWISSWSNVEKEKMLKIREEDTVLAKLVPRALNIVGISFPDSDLSVKNSYVNIKVSWTNYGDASAFMIHFYNMKESENMIKVETLEKKDAIEHNINSLEPNSRYSVIVYGMNEYGVSKGSNIIIVET